MQHPISAKFVQKIDWFEFQSKNIQSKYVTLCAHIKRLVNSHNKMHQLNKQVENLKKRKCSKFDSLDMGTYSVKWISPQRVEKYKLSQSLHQNLYFFLKYAIFVM